MHTFSVLCCLPFLPSRALSSAVVLLVSLARIVKLTSMTVHHHRCAKRASVKMASTTSLVIVIRDSREDSAVRTLMIARVRKGPFTHGFLLHF